jgi:hypothetical protein
VIPFASHGPVVVILILVLSENLKGRDHLGDLDIDGDSNKLNLKLGVPI